MKKKQTDNSSKLAYQHLCEERTDIPLFLQYDWLEGVCAGHDWDVILIRQQATEGQTESEAIVAAVPYMSEKHLWVNRMLQPDLTPYLGVWMTDEARQNAQEIARICEETIQQLAQRHIKIGYRRFPIGSPVPQQLEHQGFRMNIRRTWMLQDTQDLDAILAHFSANKRQKLKKIQNLYSVEEIDPEDFYRFHAHTCEQKNRKISYTRELLLVIWEKCHLKEQARMIGVYGKQHELLAAALMVWDKRTLYLLIDCFDHRYPDNGARELVVFEAVHQAHLLGLEIDFNTNRDYPKHYGAVRLSYFVSTRGANAEIFLEKLLDWITVK